MSNVKVVNVDNLLKKKEVVRVEIDGKTYTLGEPTVSDTMETISDIEALTKATSHLDAAKIVMDIVLRSFPELTRDELLKMKGDAMTVLFDVARGIYGDEEVDTGEKDAQGNE